MSQSHHLTGSLFIKNEAIQKSEKFTVREFVIETPGQYGQKIKFQLTNERVDLIDNHKLGSSIKVHFDIRGREHNDEFYHNLNAWKIEADDQQG